ncbi:MAG: DUF433 domain-containing protein [Duganella sp.]
MFELKTSILQNLQNWVPLPQAAIVAESSMREINRIIDERLLPDTMIQAQPSRALSVMGCAMARFYFKTALSLTKEERLKAISGISENISNLKTSELIVHREWLTIDFTDFFIATESSLNSLDSLKLSFESDPEIMSGEYVFKGTRIPVYMVTELLANGERNENILRAYPALDEELISRAIKFALAFPRRGRPSRKEELKDKVISQRTVRVKKNVQATY